MTDSCGDFDLLQRIEVDLADVVVSKWRSRKTGLTVVHIANDAPIVRAYLALRIESFDDRGLPHSLEHMAFIGGSKRYPYQRVLDRLIAQGFSHNPNAWTYEDSTYFMLNSVGEEEFLRILPLYVDHIMFPALTESTFVTEVHHIGQTGQDSGVVYCEMQARENMRDDVMRIAGRKMLYGEDSGYRRQICGLLEGLRDSDVQQIRDYHAKYYVPHNLCLIVCGHFTDGTESLISAIQRDIEPSLVEHGYNKGHRPPGWVCPVVETASANREPFKSRSAIVRFPDNNLKEGSLVMTFMGPPVNDYVHRKAIDILSIYLGSSEGFFPGWVDVDIRPEFVNLTVYVDSAPPATLRWLTVGQKLSLWWLMVKHDIDMPSMHRIIERHKRKLRSMLEDTKGNGLFEIILTDFVLGPEDGSKLRDAISLNRIFDELLRWSGDDWKALIKRYFIKSPVVTVRANPSRNLMAKLAKDEQKGIDKRVAFLGPNGLARQTEVLEKARLENSKPVPGHLLPSTSPPDVESIRWIPMQTVQDGKKLLPFPSEEREECDLAKHVDADGTELGFLVQFDHVKSGFVEVAALLSLSTLPDRLRPLMNIYQKALFRLTVEPCAAKPLNSGQVDTFKEDAISHGCSLGMQNRYTDNLRIAIKVEKNKYEKAVRLLKDLIYDLQFDAEVLIDICFEIVHEQGREGNAVLSQYQTEILFDKSNSLRAVGSLEQMRVIPKFMRLLKKRPDQALQSFEEIKQHLANPSGMRFSVSGDVLGLPRPRAIWADCFGDKLRNVPLVPALRPHESLSDIGRYPHKQAFIVSLPTIQSTYARRFTRTIQEFDHPATPALRVAVVTINNRFRRQLRNLGFVYIPYINWDIDAGLMVFGMSRSINCLEVFRQAADTLEKLVNNPISLEDAEVEAARNTAVYHVVDAESSSHSAAINSFVRQALRGLGHNFPQDAVKKFQAVTKTEVLAAIQKYFLPLFDPSSSVAVVVTPPHKADTTADGLRELGMNVEKLNYGELPEHLKSVPQDDAAHTWLKKVGRRILQPIDKDMSRA